MDDYLDFNEVFGEKDRWQLDKDAAYFEQIVEAAHHKTAAYGHLTLISQTIQER